MRSPDLLQSARSPKPTVIALALMASVTHALQPGNDNYHNVTGLHRGLSITCHFGGEGTFVRRRAGDEEQRLVILVWL